MTTIANRSIQVYSGRNLSKMPGSGIKPETMWLWNELNYSHFLTFNSSRKNYRALDLYNRCEAFYKRMENNKCLTYTLD